MKLVDAATRRPVTVFIFAVAAVVFGLVALRELALDLLPDITYPSLTVRTTYEGAAPAEVESLVTRPVENAVGVVAGVVEQTSSSRTDTSEVTLEFSWGTDMDLAALDVRERLDMLQLPVDAERPILLRFDPSLDPIVRIGVSGDEDLIRLRLLAEERVKRALERVEGVAAAVVSGGLEEEIQVEVDERKLAGLGLTVDRLVERLAQENVNLTGGRLREGRSEYLVRTVGEFQRPEDLREVIIDRSFGASVRLSEVAQVRRGHRDREIVSRIDGNESVEVAIYKEGGTNTVTVADAVKEALGPLTRELERIDPELSIAVISDQARYIRQSVQEVIETAVIGGLLAVLVLFLFLKSWRPTLIIATAIPISVVATFFLMYGSGVSLNIMSLGGLTLGIGLLVDNAIVVLESIQRRREEGLSDVEAARKGASEVARAVVSSTLTTICVFVPIVFVEGVAGQLFGDQALTVTFSLVISLIVALTVIPMFASRRLASEDEAPVKAEEIANPNVLDRIWMAISSAITAVARVLVGAVKGAGRGLARVLALLFAVPVRLFTAGYEVIARIYAHLLNGALARPLVTVLVAALLLGASLTLASGLGQELVPELVQGEFFVDVELPPGTQLAVTERELAGIERLAATLPGVERVYAIAGTSNEQGGVAGELRENLGQITVKLTPPPSREREEATIAALRERLMQEEAIEFRFGRPSYFSFRTPIEIEIRGYNLKLLKRLADDLVLRLGSVPGLTDIESSTEGGNPELEVRFDRQRLAVLGISVAEAAAVLRSKVEGEVATDIQRDDRAVDIRLRAAESYRDSVGDLSQLTVFQSGATAIPLSAVAEVLETEGPAEIRRADGSRVALVTANLVGRDLGDAADEIVAILEQAPMPSGFDWAIGGQRQEMETSFDSMKLAIGLAIFMVYLVMASQFESLLHPLVILVSVPFSLVGVLITLVVLDVTVSVVVLIGAIMLAGIVVNNAIILVDTANRLRRSGEAKLAALKEAGRLRLRPILMTTATTVLGLTPMALGLGEGSELRAPMAQTVIGGLLASTALTLLVIPAVYALVDRRR